MKDLTLIKSSLIREISMHLLDKGNSITFLSKAWSGLNSHWIYFDTVLDVAYLLKSFDKESRLIIQENTDRKSGLEKGLLDIRTNEAVMGRWNGRD